MSWNMSFEYQAEHDIVHARFNRCLLVSPADVDRWKADVEEKLAVFGRRVDLLVDLDGLEVTFTVGRLFGQARREVLERFTQRANCYGGDETTRMFLSTSGVLHGRPMAHLDSFEAALVAMRAEREASRQRVFAPFSGAPRFEDVHAAGG
ncbi:hypothetical protein POL68_26550 [Stigmatella sp. ncwal1]|uniref:Uncharacterized protein n=1 Tax=Stigmatella ashevillensis TaxID=2995309 RepID=A0ABT5DEH6_9BACT|nr:hypothetical protein [Stigmatella ashevillena]MDC0712057.1 hypothetical protein [Stigmatella ashevillena]